MNIVILDKQTLGNDIDLSKFEKYGNVILYEYTFHNEINERIKEADIVIVNKVVLDENALNEAKNLKLIVITATGMNNINLNVAKKLGIRVNNVVNYSSNSVGQHTFAMVLYLLEDMRNLDKYVQDKMYSKSFSFTYWNKSIFELDGKKWGIIGLGSIGNHVAKIASAFGCEVYTHSPSNRLYDSSFYQTDLNTILKECDVISIHTPLNEHTKYLINKKELMSMKDSALLINVARGGIINEDDLFVVLNKKEIYVGLDVLEQEPMRSDHKLFDIKHKNRLLITPHCAWSAKEARVRVMQQIEQHIKNFINY